MLRSLHPARWLSTTALVLLVICCCGTTPAFAGQPQHKEHKRDYKREIEVLEEQWRVAQIAGDEAAMEKLLAPDYLGISMTGQVNDRTQQLERMRAKHLVLTKIDLSDRKIKLVGSVAIVTSLARIEGAMDGTPMNGTYRYTRIYRRYSDGSWKITNFEVTRVPNGAAEQRQ
jgi:ketosteroid isomerase-like protein